MSFKFGRSYAGDIVVRATPVPNAVFHYNANTPALITRPGGAGTVIVFTPTVATAVFVEAKAGDYRPKTFTVASDTLETLTVTAHGYLAGDGPLRVTNSGGALPTGLAVNTDYYIEVVDANTIALHLLATLTDARVNITGNGTGTHTIGGLGTGATLFVSGTPTDSYNTFTFFVSEFTPWDAPVFEMPDRLTVRAVSASAQQIRYYFLPAGE